MKLHMPDVLCDGHAVITVVDDADDEVVVALRGRRTYLKRERRETYEDFVKRVTRFCEVLYKAGV